MIRKTKVIYLNLLSRVYFSQGFRSKSLSWQS